MAWYSLTGWMPRPEAEQLLRYYSSLAAPIVEAQREFGGLKAIDAATEYMLDKLIWGVTTLTDGPDAARLDLQFISAGAKALYEELERAAAQRSLSVAKARIVPLLRHEHVVPRRFLYTRILAGDSQWSLASAMACVVTRDEHAKLAEPDAAPANVEGWWDRYRLSNVRVWNRQGAGSWLDW